MEQPTPTFSASTNKGIIDASRCFGIFKREDCKIEGYKWLTWDEFKGIYETEMMSKKPMVSIIFIKNAKEVLKGFNYKLYECNFGLAKDLPLIISPNEEWMIVIAKQLYD